MPRFSANLSMLFTEHDFLDRFDAARPPASRVEYLGPYDHAPEEVAARLNKNGLSQVLFNVPPATGPAASAASPSCRGASRNSAPASTRR